MKLYPSALTPIVQNQNLDLNNEVVAIILRNAGTATVSLWSGSYTLDSKETLSLNVTEAGGEIIISNIPVMFDTSTGAVKKLQIITLTVQNNC